MRIFADYRLRHLVNNMAIKLTNICIMDQLGDNCIVFENFTTSIGDLMVAN
jgi:hypothetical protein